MKSNAPWVVPTEEEEQCDVIRGLGYYLRLRAVAILLDKPLAIGDLAERMDVCHGTLAAHIQVMKAAGILYASRNKRAIAGKRPRATHYAVNKEVIRELIEFLCRLIGEDSPLGSDDSPNASQVIN